MSEASTSEKKCKYCATMIPAEAKICPHCRKRIPVKASTLVIVAFVIFGIGMCVAVTQPPSTQRASSVEKAETTPLTKKAQTLKKSHPAWSNDICNTVAEKKIIIGMTTEQVRTAWGRPYKINTSTGAGWESEQWVMQKNLNSDYLYFHNGILTSMQQSK